MSFNFLFAFYIFGIIGLVVGYGVFLAPISIKIAEYFTDDVMSPIYEKVFALVMFICVVIPLCIVAGFVGPDSDGDCRDSNQILKEAKE